MKLILNNKHIVGAIGEKSWLEEYPFLNSVIGYQSSYLAPGSFSNTFIDLSKRVGTYCYAVMALSGPQRGPSWVDGDIGFPKYNFYI